MKQRFFTNLPSEIITSILLRLSVRTVAISKCVCKPWLHLLETDDFVKSHFSRSTPALAVMMPESDSNWCNVFELEDYLDLGSHDCSADPLTKFDFPHGATIQGSANGLLFLHDRGCFGYVCNPITREFCELDSLPQGVAYGFGASKITGQLKVVSISSESLINPKSDCHVCTLGTESWRRVEAPASFQYRADVFGKFVNGNLHWLELSNPYSAGRILCFDVEAECFRTFSTPIRRFLLHDQLFTLSDCLCFLGQSSEYGIVIWLMKEYEVDKSWSKEYVIPLSPDFSEGGLEFVQPIKVFKNGDILMLCDDNFFIYYSNKTKTTQEVGLFGERGNCFCVTSKLLTPSFLSLKSFGMENIFTF